MELISGIRKKKPLHPLSLEGILNNLNDKERMRYERGLTMYLGRVPRNDFPPNFETFKEAMGRRITGDLTQFIKSFISKRQPAAGGKGKLVKISHVAYFFSVYYSYYYSWIIIAVIARLAIVLQLENVIQKETTV